MAAIVRAKKEIQVRALARFEREQVEFEAKQSTREAREKGTGKKPQGKPPQSLISWPQAEDQVNPTDAESRIMPSSSRGFVLLVYCRTIQGNSKALTFIALEPY